MATNVKNNCNDCEDKDFSSSKFGWDSKPRFNFGYVKLQAYRALEQVRLDLVIVSGCMVVPD